MTDIDRRFWALILLLAVIWLIAWLVVRQP